MKAAHIPAWSRFLKLLRLGAFSVLLSAALFQAQPMGLVAYWALDETSGTVAADSSGSGLTGTYVGAPVPSTDVAPSSYPNPRSLLTGTNNAVRAGNFGNFTRTTVSVWIKRTGTIANRESIVSYKEGDGVNQGFVLCLNEGGASQFPRIFVQVDGTWRFAEQAVAIPLNSWIHLVGTYDGTSLRLFRDGAQVAIANFAGNMTNTGSQNTVIGARASFNQHWFPGLIDDVRIYNRALSAAEVGVLAAGVPAPTGLIATLSGPSVSLVWTAPPQPLTYTYNVKRSTDPAGPFATIAPGVATTGYSDSTVTAGLTYHYVVSAVSAAESGNSAPASVTTGPGSQKEGEEGIKGEHCSLGSIRERPGMRWAMVAAVLSLLALRRRPTGRRSLWPSRSGGAILGP